MSVIDLVVYRVAPGINIGGKHLARGVGEWDFRSRRDLTPANSLRVGGIACR
jgi:hypothetical protein